MHPEYGPQLTFNGTNHVDDVVIFTCPYGYNLLGNYEITCLLDGTWTSIPPTCDGIILCLVYCLLEINFTDTI